MLASRLAKDINGLVRTNQSAFRTIQDNFWFVQLAAKNLKASKISALFFKIYIARAFDTVSWSFFVSI